MGSFTKPSAIPSTPKPLPDLTYYCDNQRHLVCRPYSIDNLHLMAQWLGIDRAWFHNKSYAHYDIPKRRVGIIGDKCIKVSPREILAIVKGG